MKILTGSRLSIAFDLPTRMGYDSDHPLAAAKVGKTGVAVDSLDDMQTLFDDIRLEDVFTSLNANATGYILVGFYVAFAKKQGADLKKLTGSVQNDILAEYATCGAYIYPPKPAMAITVDVFEWCRDQLPGWNPVALSGCPFREAGCTAVQELAFARSNAKAYARAAMERGLDIDVFGQRFSLPHEPLTPEMETAVGQLIGQIDRLGGSVSAIEQGFIQKAIASGGNNRRTEDTNTSASDDSLRQVQIEKLNALKRRRDPGRVDSVLQDLNDKAASGENIMPVVVEAAERLCTLGEIADTLREVFGEYR